VRIFIHPANVGIDNNRQSTLNQAETNTAQTKTFEARFKFRHALGSKYTCKYTFIIVTIFFTHTVYIRTCETTIAQCHIQTFVYGT